MQAQRQVRRCESQVATLPARHQLVVRSPLSAVHQRVAAASSTFLVGRVLLTAVATFSCRAGSAFRAPVVVSVCPRLTVARLVCLVMCH